MKRKLPEIIVEEELEKILVKEKNLKLKLGYALGFYECMRISEVINLKPSNIDRGRKIIKILQGKTGDRNIPIAPEVLRGLRHLPLFCSLRTLQRRFKAISKKVLHKNLHFHCLRHSGITHYLNKKRWNVLEVQRFAGHSKLATTQIYAHINPQDLVERMWD